MWSYKSEITGLEVVESFNGFYLYLKEECKGMGDGVDMFWESDGKHVPVGTDQFYLLLADMVDDPETVEAYFGEKYVP